MRWGEEVDRLARYPINLIKTFLIVSMMFQISVLGDYVTFSSCVEN